MYMYLFQLKLNTGTQGRACLIAPGVYLIEVEEYEHKKS
jgi:hypothetical protein